ncbi:MAG: succinate--CoA ligase subunit alpha [Acidobacteriota bacterium]
MSILVDEQTRLLVQGITGQQGTLHTRLMLEYGTNIVAGVTPGRGGQRVCDVPVFDTVAEACERTRPNVSIIFVPAMTTRDAAFEAITARLPLITIITEHVPIHDMLRIRAHAARHGVRLIGPNGIGAISPGKTKVGIMPGMLYGQGSVGIVSRSGTLTHETASLLRDRGFGNSTCVGIGGDPIHGIGFVDALDLFASDPDTALVVILGEIGGGDEEQAAAYLSARKYPKPVLAYVAGRLAPPEKRMGHAGAIVRQGTGTAQAKMAALRHAGVHVASSLKELTHEIAARL